MKVLGINSLFHDPSAALVIDGVTVAAAEEERFSRRKHGHRPVPFAAWELPELAARWCLESAGLAPSDLDVVAYSYDPSLAVAADDLGLNDPWDWLRQLYAERAAGFLASALPGLDPAQVRHVPHHVAHAASAGLAGLGGDGAVLVLDGRGEQASSLLGHYRDGKLDVLATQPLPHSVGFLFEDLTEHLGFLRSSDEYKVMALASHGTPRFLDLFRERLTTDGSGGFRVNRLHGSDLGELVPARHPDEPWQQAHADLAASAQRRLEELLLELGGWLHEQTGALRVGLAGGVALNCVANSVLATRGPFEQVWVQPAAGDAGTALGAALSVVAEHGQPVQPFTGADLGRSWDDGALETELRRSGLAWQRPRDIAEACAEVLAADGIVAWYQGRSEFGPRALGHRSLLAHPGPAVNLDRLNDIKGRESFRPVAPMVLEERAGDIFSGPLPSPYMLFVHDVAPEWRDRVAAVVHVDGTARVQTVGASEPLLRKLLGAFETRTGLPVLVNTSLNTAGRPMVDSPQDALECFGSAPIDALALGPFLVRKAAVA
ncbi:MAG: carbamoyltransferase family protein [Actinomycetales bacterium]